MIEYSQNKWVEVLTNGPSKICGTQSLKILSDIVCLSRPHYFKIFKGRPPQILLGPFLSTLTQIYLSFVNCFSYFLILE